MSPRKSPPQGAVIDFTARPRLASSLAVAPISDNPASVAGIPAAFVLPPVKLPPGFFRLVCHHPAVGMTERQANLAFDALLCEPEPHEALRRFSDASQRLIDAKHEMEAALTAQREELLQALWRHYPAAARRIMKGLRKA